MSVRATARERGLAQRHLADRDTADDEGAAVARCLALYREELFDRFDVVRQELERFGDTRAASLLFEAMDEIRHERLPQWRR